MLLYRLKNPLDNNCRPPDALVMEANVSAEARDNRTEHLWLLALSVAALLGSVWLQFGEDGGLTLPMPVVGTQVALPDACWSRRILGIACPGCGLTRSFVAMARGGVQPAFYFNPLGPILFVICFFQIPYRLAMYFGNVRLERMADRFEIVTWLIIAGLIILWAFRLAQDISIFGGI
jgi:hypothetical protein